MIRRWTLVVMALLLGISACGLSANGSPQAIPPEDLPAGLLDPNPSSSTTLPESGATTTITVYFLTRSGDGSALAPVQRQVKTSEVGVPGARILALFAQPTAEEQRRGVTTSVPADATLLSAPPPVNNGDLVVNVSSELFSVQGQDLANAFAQIVFTVSEIPGINGVRFLRDGVEIAALDAEGTEQQGAVSTADYRSLVP